MSFIQRHLIDFMHGLLAPPGEICLTCGSKSKLSMDLPGICRRCAEAIPWIMKPRCPYCGRAFGCPDCLREEAAHRSFICNRSSVQYTSVMREWLAQYKYRGHERYASLLIAMISRSYQRMEDEMSARISSALPLKSQRISGLRLRAQPSFWKPDIVTFVPVSPIRLVERGFNQAEVLAAGVASMHRLPMLPLLVRTEHTEKQSFKSRQQRIVTMRHAFTIHPKAVEGLDTLCKDTQGAHHLNIADDTRVRILLVDDIYTTGSTIDACAAVLRSFFHSWLGKGVEIYSLTWARS